MNNKTSACGPYEAGDSESNASVIAEPQMLANEE